MLTRTDSTAQRMDEQQDASPQPTPPGDAAGDPAEGPSRGCGLQAADGAVLGKGRVRFIEDCFTDYWLKPAQLVLPYVNQH